VTAYDPGLTAAQEKRAKDLHRSSIVIDLMSQHAGANIFAHYSAELQADLKRRLQSSASTFDAYMDAVYWPYEMSKAGESNLIRDWYLESGLTCGACGLDVHDGHNAESVRWESLVLRYADLPWMRYVTRAEEIRQAKRDGVIAFYANCQPTSPIPRDLERIDAAYGRGLRSLMLTYNLMDHVGVGCTERVDAGLSRFGLQVVAHCNQLGIIVDVSHCGHLTTLDACRHSRSPVTANHTAARGLHPHARGKSDDALRAIADTGGVIGVVAVPTYLTAQRSATLEHMLDHIEYIGNLIGLQHVAIGTDWPLQAPQDILAALLSPANTAIGFREEDRLDVTQNLVGFEDCRDLRNITRGLVKRNFSDAEMRGVLGENALRVFAAVCG
jgi:membrane dipeptidase